MYELQIQGTTLNVKYHNLRALTKRAMSFTDRVDANDIRIIASFGKKKKSFTLNEFLVAMEFLDIFCEISMRNSFQRLKIEK